MELDATGIEGQNQKLLQLQTKFEALMKSAKDGLEFDASTLAATASTDITSTISELRTLTPQLPELPSVNLQSQLSGLSGLVAGSTQHTQALADIAGKFGSALTTSGFSLDTLVSDALSAVTAGTSLSASIPNFKMPADGLTAAVESAIEVLQANPIKPEDLANIAEKVSDLVESPNFTALKAELETTASTIAEQMKTIDVSGLQLPTDTVITLEKLISDTENPIRKLPTEDGKYFKPTEESTEVAFQFTLDPGPPSVETDRRSPGALGGRVEESSSVVTTTKITTPEGATTTTKKSVEKIVSGGTEHVRVVSRKANISKHGFSHRPIEVTELFYESDVTETPLAEVSVFKKTIKLENWPIKILYVAGYVPTAKSSSGRTRIFAFRIKPSGSVTNEAYHKARWDVYEAVGNQIDISTKRLYGPAPNFVTVDVAGEPGTTKTRPHNHKGVVFKVTYQYADKYDPSVSKPPK
jgi:hypothetical protein